MSVVEPVLSNSSSNKELNRVSLRKPMKVARQWAVYCMDKALNRSPVTANSRLIRAYRGTEITGLKQLKLIHNSGKVSDMKNYFRLKGITSLDGISVQPR